MGELVGMASMMLMMMLLLPVTGVLMAVTPFLQRRGEVFAVTVPSSAQRDPYLRSLKRRYALIMGAVTAVLTAAGVAAALAMNEAAIMVVLLVGTLGLLLGGYALMLRYRAKTKAYKREQGWEAQVQETVAVVGEADAPRVIALSWNLLYVPVILVTVAIAVVGYPHMPEMISHARELRRHGEPLGAEGPHGGGVPRAHAAVPGGVHGLLALDHLEVEEMGRAGRAGHLGARLRPVRSRAERVLAGERPFADRRPGHSVRALVDGAGVARAGGVLRHAAGHAHRGGIARHRRRVRAGGLARVQAHAGLYALLADDDEHWKFGIFYVNPDDLAFVLPERFGVGWTFNYARPVTWVIVVGGFLVTVAFIVAVSVLV